MNGPLQELMVQRAAVKDRVQWATSTLGPIMAVVPGGEPLRNEVDQLLQQLESMSPTDKPLNVKVDAWLKWRKNKSFMK